MLCACAAAPQNKARVLANFNRTAGRVSVCSTNALCICLMFFFTFFINRHTFRRCSLGTSFTDNLCATTGVCAPTTSTATAAACNVQNGLREKTHARSQRDEFMAMPCDDCQLPLLLCDRAFTCAGWDYAARDCRPFICRMESFVNKWIVCILD